MATFMPIAIGAAGASVEAQTHRPAIATGSPSAACALNADIGFFDRLVGIKGMSCAAARKVATLVETTSEPTGWTCQGDVQSLHHVGCGSVSGATFTIQPAVVLSFTTRDRAVTCADEPTGYSYERGGMECFAGTTKSGCDGEIMRVAQVPISGATYRFSGGCSSGSPLALGVVPVFRVLATGKSLSHGGFACTAIAQMKVRCVNISKHGFELSPTEQTSF